MKSQILRKLNPLNSIFGRLFMWFWLTTTVLIICTAITVRHFVKGPEIQTIPADEQETLQQIAQAFQSKMAIGVHQGPGKINQALRILNNRFESSIVILDISADQIYSAALRMPPPFERRFKNLAMADAAYGFMSGNRLFFGPANIEVGGRQYSIFNGRELRFPLFQQRIELFVLLALSISGALCFMLAWSFTRPIKTLRDVTQEMAKGNLQAGTIHSSSRQDEIGELSHDFQTMAIKLNELLENQKRLLADISHELRSPLARLQLAIGIAQQHLDTQSEPQQVDADPMQQQLLQRIEKEAHQIDAMIGSVLQLSRLESRSQEISKHKQCFPSCIDGILEDARYEAQNHSKQLHSDNLPTTELTADISLLGSALENIIRNAIKYAEQDIRVTAEVVEHKLYIRVSDDGCGAPEHELNKLFTPFYRVSFARNRETGGTGLGLAIATQAINAHNGVITAKNNDKGGLSVEIILPL